jgi:sugar lactone lactonase YvrE
LDLAGRRRLILWIALALVSLATGAAAVFYFLNARAPEPLRPRVAFLVKATRTAWPVHLAELAGGPLPGVVDGPAQQARFSDPFGVAVASNGTVYVADGGDSNRIRAIASNGQVSTLAGSAEGFADGPGTRAAFHTPSGLALDLKGNLYVADTGNHAIRRVTPEGMVTTLAGNGTPGSEDGRGAAARFNGPIGVAVDRHGNVYVSDTYNDRIRRITPQGEVSTLAGSLPGHADGAAAGARFDTPTGIAVDRNGIVYVADSQNESIRRIHPDGQVDTWLESQKGTQVIMRRPMGLALTHDGFLYVADEWRGRVLQVTPQGVLFGLTGVGIDIAVGDATRPRLARAAMLAVRPDGALAIADAAARKLFMAVPADAKPIAREQASVLNVRQAAAATAELPGPALLKGRWPVAPQDGWHEVVGVVGEARGSYSGESLHHFHNGLDVQAAIGTPVLAVADEKVSQVLANWAFGSLGEGMAVDAFSYIHMRVGRDARQRILDPERFLALRGEKGRVERIRLRRGTRFRAGEVLGAVNPMAHVHLVHQPGAYEANAIALALPGLVDRVAPRIDRVELQSPGGRALTRREQGRVLVERSGGPLSIVVEAWDQMDGNEARRKLGLYRVGYQILDGLGHPLPGFEQPRVTIEFNRLPPDQESVTVAYADRSGITVYGNAVTRFRYLVTNTVRDGRAQPGSWDPAALLPGQYTIRAFAMDFAGNVALDRRDLEITLR